MRRCAVMRWACLVSLLLGQGCATGRSLNPFASNAPADKKPPAADDHNPFKKGDSLADASPKTSQDVKADEDGIDPDKTGKNAPKVAALDPELAKLIEGELQHVPPEERDKLRAQWTQFDPAFIRELVENHRAARELSEGPQKAVQLAAAKGDTTAADELDLAAPQTVKSRPAKLTGSSIGTVSPWDETDDKTTGPAIRSGKPGTAGAAKSPADPTAASPSNENGLVIAPGTVHDKLARKDPAVKPVGDVLRANGPVTLPKDDFSDLAPPSATLQAATQPKHDAPLSADGSATQTAANSAFPAQPGDPNGPAIQPGLAPPANVLASLPLAAKETRPAVGSNMTAGGAAAASPNVVAPASFPGQPSAAESAQPVQLESPTDIPGNSNDSSGNLGKKPAGAGGGNANGGKPESTGLASLLRVINPKELTGSRGNSQAVRWHDEIQKVVAAAVAEAAQSSVGTTDAEKLAYIEKQVHLRMLYVLAGKSPQSVEPISGIDPADQEFWQQVFWSVSNYFDKSRISDPSDRATQTIAQLRTAVNRLQEKSKLELHNVTFCHKIKNYGNYERFPRDEFTAGQPVLLYAEVENFKSEPTADGPYRTILKSTIEIYDSRNQLVQSMPFSPEEDRCLSPRRDYFNSYEFIIPQRIGLGPHTLKLTVEDQVSQKIATYTLNFTVK